MSTTAEATTSNTTACRCLMVVGRRSSVVGRRAVGSVRAASRSGRRRERWRRSAMVRYDAMVLGSVLVDLEIDGRARRGSVELES